MRDLPGLYQKPFYIKLEVDSFFKGAIIKMSHYEQEFVVVKVYRYHWWKGLLAKLGFKVRICEIKVKPYNDNHN